MKYQLKIISFMGEPRPLNYPIPAIESEVAPKSIIIGGVCGPDEKPKELTKFATIFVYKLRWLDNPKFLPHVFKALIITHRTKSYGSISQIVLSLSLNVLKTWHYLSLHLVQILLLKELVILQIMQK